MDLKELVCLRTPSPIKSLGFSSDCRWLACGENSGNITIWDVSQLEKGDVEPFARYPIPNINDIDQHDRSVCSLAFRPLTSYLVSSTLGGIVSAINLLKESNNLLVVPKELQRKHILCVNFSRQGDLMALGGGNLSSPGFGLEVLKREQNRWHRQVNIDMATDITAADFSMDGKTLFSTSHTGLVQAWDSKTGDEQWSDDLKEPLECIAISPNGRDLIVGTQRGHLFRWDLRSLAWYVKVLSRKEYFFGYPTEEEKKEIRQLSRQRQREQLCYDAERSYVTSIVFSQRFEFMICGGWDAKIHFFDTSRYDSPFDKISILRFIRNESVSRNRDDVRITSLSAGSSLSGQLLAVCGSEGSRTKKTGYLILFQILD